MNRILFGIVTATWFATCWWWYTCQIKKVCDSNYYMVDAAAAIKPLAASINTDSVEESSENIRIEEEINRIIIHFPSNYNTKEDDIEIDAYLKKWVSKVQQTDFVQVTGHTDDVGTSVDNLELARQRAQHIKNVLVSFGLSSNQIYVSSFGEDKPRSSNDTAKGRYDNRRVEIELTKKHVKNSSEI